MKKASLYFVTMLMTCLILFSQGYATEIAGASFSNGDFLTWEELSKKENGEKYGYDASEISDAEIGSWAFSGCSSLTSIEIPASVTEIVRYAFDGCSSLNDIKVEMDNVNYCSENGVLFNKEKTELVRYPEGKKDKTYSIPNGVTSIGWGAFEGCSSLTSVEIPNGVTYIAFRAFEGCSSLTSVEILASVTYIGEAAFIGCSSLTSVEIPASVTYIEYGAFSGCSSLVDIKVEMDNVNYCSENGVLFNKEKTELVRYPEGKKDKTYSIPNGVTSIGWGAFSGCSSLTSIEIPTSVTKIGYGAFSDCSSLTSVEIPASVTYIGDHAFDDNVKIIRTSAKIEEEHTKQPESHKINIWIVSGIAIVLIICLILIIFLNRKRINTKIAEEEKRSE